MSGDNSRETVWDLAQERASTSALLLPLLYLVAPLFACFPARCANGDPRATGVVSGAAAGSAPAIADATVRRDAPHTSRCIYFSPSLESAVDDAPAFACDTKRAAERAR